LKRGTFLAALVLGVSVSSTARAGDGTVTIQGGKITGAGTLNVAAGNQNQQTNAALISSGAIASPKVVVGQETDYAGNTDGLLGASIAADSFSDSTGWLAINGAAGSGNQQANLAIIALGTTGAALSDTALSQARASHEPTAGPDTGTAVNDRSVAIGAGAFADSSGLVQVSLIGGDRNTSANIFALSSSAGATP
jgi:hypothetical protein